MRKTYIFCCFLFFTVPAVFAQQDNVITGKYYTFSLPEAWQETGSHIMLNHIQAKYGISQSDADSLFKCYVDSQNYYNVLIIAERVFSKKALQEVTIEQLVQRT